MNPEIGNDTRLVFFVLSGQGEIEVMIEETDTCFLLIPKLSLRLGNKYI